MAVTPEYGSPDVWAEKVDPVYEALSAAVIAASPVRLTGRLIADLGAGTGATSRAIVRVGGRPVAVDVSYPMLAHRRTERPQAVVADITALPIAAHSLGGAIAAFSLSHIDDPAAALAEAARVTEPGGPVLAGVFADTGSRHPAGPILDRLAAQRGWAPPSWYLHLKQDLEPRMADASELTRLAASAGLIDVTLFDREVDAGLDTAEDFVGWRLGHPAMAPFVAQLPPAERLSLEAEAVAEVGVGLEPLRLAVRILFGKAPATCSRGAGRPPRPAA